MSKIQTFAYNWGIIFAIKIALIALHKSKKDRQHNGQKNKGQKDKQRTTKHYTENYKTRWTQVLRKVPAPPGAPVVLLVPMAAPEQVPRGLWLTLSFDAKKT